MPPKSWLFAECATCGETGPSALTRRGDGFICGNCEARERGRPERLCARCGKMAPFEGNHIYGRQVEEEKEPWCINCHRIFHALGSEMKIR